MLKTMTLGNDTEDDDSPTLVVCEGHVDAKTFNEAFFNEGWSGKGEWSDDDLKYIWGCFEGDTFIQCELKYSTETKPYTVTYWD
jgi:hypothetical protein